MSKNRNLANLIASSATPLADVVVDTVFTGDSITLPAGTTGERPVSAGVGMVRYNTTLGFTEQYTVDGWTGIAPPPTISTVSPSTYNGEQGTEFTINGSNYDSTATVKFITTQGTEYTAATVSRVNNSQLIATTPQDFTVANEPLKVRVINGSGLAYTLDNAIDCGGLPAWTTASGTLSTLDENTSLSTSIAATDPDTNAVITYSVASGTLPSGVTLNSSSGSITGTTPSVSSDTTYNFTARASDNAGNNTDRSFSIVVTYNKISTVDFFGDGSGKALYQLENNYTDVSGNYSGTGYSSGSASYDASNKRFGSYAFNSNGPNIINIPGPVNAYPYTVSAWVSTANWGGTTGQNRVIMNCSINGQRLSLTYADFNNNGAYDFMIMFGGAGHWDYRTASSPPSLTASLGSFVHICYSIAGTNDANVYLNSTQLTPTNNGGTHGGFAGWRIGGNTDGGEFWRGNIDQVRVFNRQLSGSEVATLYAHESIRS